MTLGQEFEGLRTRGIEDEVEALPRLETRSS